MSNEDIIAELRDVIIRETFFEGISANNLARACWDVVEKMMEWRPIETAPKDGKDILLAKEPRAPGELFWRYGVGCFAVNGILFDWPYGGRPTHWQPLPPPPLLAEDCGEILERHPDGEAELIPESSSKGEG